MIGMLLFQWMIAACYCAPVRERSSATLPICEHALGCLECIGVVISVDHSSGGLMLM